MLILERCPVHPQQTGMFLQTCVLCSDLLCYAVILSKSMRVIWRLITAPKIGILKLVRFILGKFRQFLWWSSPGSCPGDAIWRALATMSWSLPFVLRPPWGCARGKGRPGRRRELHNVSSKGAGERRQPGRTLVHRNNVTPLIILFWYCTWDLFFCNLPNLEILEKGRNYFRSHCFNAIIQVIIKLSLFLRFFLWCW